MLFVKLLLITLLIINFFIFLFAVKVIQKKGGVKFLKLFLFKKFKDNSRSLNDFDKVQEFNFYKPTDGDIVFLGDSLIMLGNWHEFYPGATCRNRGIGGNATKDILNRLNNIVELKPQKIFLLVGINDLLAKVNKKQLLKSYKNIILTIKKESPETSVYIMSLLPINEVMCQEVLSIKKGVVVEVTNEQINEVNQELKELCSELNIVFVDIHSSLIDEAGELTESLTTDGLHINFHGYVALSKNLEMYVYEENHVTVNS